MKNKKACKILIMSILYLIDIQLFAQKLPNIQEGNASAPASVKIDGNTAEWGRQLKAFNKSTLVYYTIANDNNNVYLIVRSDSKDISNKVIQGGITLKIENADKSKAIAPVSVTYPVMPADKDNGLYIRYLLDTTKSSNADVLAINNVLEGASKNILVSGSKLISDPAISVYNEYGIKAAQHIDSKKIYSYELAIPLRYLSPAMDDKGAFRYNIRLNGTDPKAVISMAADRTGGDPNSPETKLIDAKINQENLYILANSPTDLSGTYQLAK